MLAFYSSFSRWPYYFYLRHGRVRSTSKSPLPLRQYAISLRFHVQTTWYQNSDSFLRVTWADDGEISTSMRRLLCEDGDAMNGYARDNARMTRVAIPTTFVVARFRNHRINTRRGRCVCTQRPLANLNNCVGLFYVPMSKSQPDYSPIYIQLYTQSYAKPTPSSPRATPSRRKHLRVR